MLPSNIEREVREFLHKKGGWARVQECAKAIAYDRVAKEWDGTRRTNFYRWRKKVEKGKIEGFQYVPMPKNKAYIGLGTADPSKLHSSKKDFGFFDWWERRAERRQLDRERRLLDLEVEYYALIEEIGMDEDEYDSESPEERMKRRQKYRRLLKDKYPNAPHKS